MAYCGLPVESAMGDMASWVSPSSTPPSACLSSTTVARPSETPTETFHHPSIFFGQKQLQLLQQGHALPLFLQQYKDHNSNHWQCSEKFGMQQMPCASSQHSVLMSTQVVRVQRQCESPVKHRFQDLHVSTMATSLDRPKRHVVSCQAPATAFNLIEQQQQHQEQLVKQLMQQQQQLEDERIRLREGRLAGSLCQAALPRMVMKRPREKDPLEGQSLRSNRQCCHFVLPPSCSTSTNSTNSFRTFRRCLQRQQSLDSDGTQSGSSFTFAVAATISANFVNAANSAAPPALASTSCSTVLNSKPLSALPAAWGSCQMRQDAVLAARCHWIRASTCAAVQSVPPLAPPAALCSTDGEEFILQATRALRLCPDTCGQLAIHVWRRVNGIVRMVLSIRDPDIDGGDPRVAASTFRIYASACLWIASKMEEQRRLVSEARVLAALVQTSAEVLCAAELRLLTWVEWCPLRGYLPMALERVAVGREVL